MTDPQRTAKLPDLSPLGVKDWDPREWRTVAAAMGRYAADHERECRTCQRGAADDFCEEAAYLRQLEDTAGAHAREVPYRAI